MRKQTLILSIIVLLAILIIGGWLFFFFRQKRQTSEPGLTIAFSPVIAEASPTASPGSSQFELVSDHQVLAPVFSEKMIYLFDQTEKTLISIVPVLDIYKVKNLSETKLDNVFSIVWSSDRKQVLIGFYQNQLVRRYAVFDLEQNLTFLLPDYVQEAVWSPDGKKLAVQHYSASKKEAYLSLLNSDGTKEEKILNLNLSDLKLFWPGNNYLVFYQKPAPFYALETIFAYDFSNKQLKTISLPIREKYRKGFYGFDLLPSPDGKTIIISLTNESGAGLETYLYSLETGQLTDFPVKTLVQKCAFAQSNEAVYCAYSNQVAGANNLPFSYWQGKIRPNDSFAKFNFKTGELKVYSENTIFDAKDLAVAPEEDYLLFINRADSKLYRLKL
ncbi:MAG: hypothetical protein AB1721_02270 [Patescibacteria group bacterium]